jgi:CHAT domain-containing protein
LARHEDRVGVILEELRLTGAADLERISLLQGRVYSPKTLLDTDTLLLEYFAVGDDLIIFGVDHQRVQAVRVPAALSAIGRLERLLTLNLEAAAASPSRRVALTPNAQQLLRRLYSLLIEPVGDWVATRRRLLVVPHGPLHQLPFAALHDGSAYIVERFEIGVAPSASTLVFCCKDRPPPPPRALIIAHSASGALPGALAEAAAVASLFPGDSLLEEDATIDNVRQRAPDAGLIHFATHGISRLDAPLFSHLRLADGQLTALDCFELELHGALVTLSACESGRGVVAAGDDPIGLSRALLYAGARCVVQTLWRVDDAAMKSLMESFYAGLHAGRSPAAALRAAQMEFLRGDSLHPFLWAPLVLIGDWRT